MILEFFAHPFAADGRGCEVWRPALTFAAEVADNCLLHWFDTDLNRVLEIDGNMIEIIFSIFYFLKIIYFFFVYLRFLSKCRSTKCKSILKLCTAYKIIWD